MRRPSVLFTSLMILWISSGIWSATAEAQIQTLPPTTAKADNGLNSPNETLLSAARPLDLGVALDDRGFAGQYWTWQGLPEGLLFRSYLAGGREARFASQWVHERDQGWFWDVTLGGRVGILRYGTDDLVWPEGWQIDIEGAAFPRLAIEDERKLVACDFRFGIPLTFRRGPWESKFAYYHLSSHLGDEYMETHPSFERINYSRDTLVWAVALRPDEALRLYAEVGWAFYADEGSEPWECQFGIDYSPMYLTDGCSGPFFAINSRLREEVDFGGNMTVQTGWQWWGQTGRLLRTGLHYFNGKSDQYEFVNQHEEQIGIGIWYDY